MLFFKSKKMENMKQNIAKSVPTKDIIIARDLIAKDVLPTSAIAAHLVHGKGISGIIYIGVVDTKTYITFKTLRNTGVLFDVISNKSYDSEDKGIEAYMKTKESAQITAFIKEMNAI